MMKKSFVLTAFCAMACLTGCQREPVASGNQKDGQLEEVNAQFVFNIATDATSQTKQSSEVVQAGGTSFRGIEKARLLTYSQQTGTGANVALVDDKILTSPATASKIYDLSRLLGASSNDELVSRRILPMSLPLNTNTMLFYGKSPDRLADGDEEIYGKVGYTVSTNPSETSFTLTKRLSDETGFGAAQKLLAGMLSAIMNNGLAVADFSEDGIDVDADDFPAGGISWKTYGSVTNGKSPVSGEKMCALEEQLAYLYKQMTATNYDPDNDKDELRAGSGEAILQMLQEMRTSISRIADPVVSMDVEAYAKHLAKQILAHINQYVDVNSDGTLKFKTLVKDGESSASAASAVGIARWYTKFDTARPSQSATLTDTEITALKGLSLDAFPLNFHLMRGATFMTWKGGYFEYPANFVSEVFGVEDQSFSPSHFYYPSELLYFGNSPVRTSALEHLSDGYPTTAALWRKNGQWPLQQGGLDDWTGTHIVSQTRSVAMKHNIRYGVAMLETRVGYSSKVLEDGMLQDNTSGSPKTIVVKDNSFLLTGIVVGGQPSEVGWDFLPVGSRNSFIYDKAIASQAIPAGKSSGQSGDGSSFDPNYTTVFDNYSTGDTQDIVYIALEFKNNTGHDFMGNYNLIRDGGYFYLVGKLDPAGKAWPIADAAGDEVDDCIIPPYTTAGASTKKPRIFIQDCMTKATFKLGPNALKSAYLTVPDLRASSLTLGLSVNIVWKPGLEYKDVVIGGN